MNLFGIKKNWLTAVVSQFFLTFQCQRFFLFVGYAEFAVREIINEILNILAIYTEDTTSTGAVAIESEGGPTSDNIGVT